MAILPRRVRVRQTARLQAAWRPPTRNSASNPPPKTNSTPGSGTGVSRKACRLPWTSVALPTIQPWSLMSQAKSKVQPVAPTTRRSEEHTSELQSLMRISYAVFCLKKKKQKHSTQQIHNTRNDTNQTPDSPESTK